MKRLLNRSKDTNRASGVADTVIVEPLHNWAVFFEVKAIELILKVGTIFGGDCPDQVYILIRMKSGKIFLVCIVIM